MVVAFDRVLLDIEPFDYYMFGQNYIRPLVDFRSSYVGNVSLFFEMEEKLNQGHNIVLISNHQTETDPAIIALLLESTNPHVAENLTYIAGDRVITDPLCKPFMQISNFISSTNLICVYSKKHMLDVPELIEMIRKSNTRSLKEMALLLRISPSFLHGLWHLYSSKELKRIIALYSSSIFILMSSRSRMIWLKASMCSVIEPPFCISKIFLETNSCFLLTNFTKDSITKIENYDLKLLKLVYSKHQLHYLTHQKNYD
ncbi:glycerol-3-phosphate acyltransferase [Citrus sinensis]|uniref:Glycerol-3-phosphate acyltransferase n=1 Tax=Citrus sinensis TaxID=2711 RepID=A0ACB8JRT2_CITSI|nr:glycerol-3-phosphate acyltransferase [Citrus sinensis]